MKTEYIIGIILVIIVIVGLYFVIKDNNKKKLIDSYKSDPASLASRMSFINSITSNWDEQAAAEAAIEAAKAAAEAALAADKLKKKEATDAVKRAEEDVTKKNIALLEIKKVIIQLCNSNSKLCSSSPSLGQVLIFDNDSYKTEGNGYADVTQLGKFPNMPTSTTGRSLNDKVTSVKIEPKGKYEWCGYQHHDYGGYEDCYTESTNRVKNSDRYSSYRTRLMCNHIDNIAEEGCNKTPIDLTNFVDNCKPYTNCDNLKKELKNDLDKLSQLKIRESKALQELENAQQLLKRRKAELEALY